MPSIKTLDGFDWSWPKKINRAQLQQLFRLDFLPQHGNVVLLGSVAAQLEAAPRVAFAAGACTASLLWFALLGFGARLLAPVFERPVAWRVLDIGIGVVMWWIAAGLAWSQLR